MKNSIIKKQSLLFLFVLAVNLTFAQVKPSQALKAWDNMSAMVIGTAEAMPANYYSFKPTKELRSFADQIGHTSGANYLFASVVKLTAPKPSPISGKKDKTNVVKDLKASFEFIKSGMKKLTQQDLNEEIKFFGSTMSRLQAILIMTSHLQREHGKTTIYTRLKNIAPAKSGGW
ncbi:DinB family protein [Flavobacteriaceae bacterium S356]|uniref:DinB family protein n=1 Tax=Asprobacillus argus TaxID=3076534 RepID=A0ABU3LBV7_9FLAO|nr:DinB family protein [Flavobacteriaceae bacterium S356]